MELASKTLVLATGNAGKVRELKELFQQVPFELKSLGDFGDIVDVDETGSTFRENAELKASGFAVQTLHLSLADDSGLEVEALGNAPGVYSARFAGADAFAWGGRASVNPAVSAARASLARDFSR